MDSNRIKSIILLVVALTAAFYLGIAAALAQKEAVAWVLGFTFFTICLLLGRNIWILIPATLSLKGNINFLPGDPAPWHLMTAVALAFFLMRVATRRQKISIRWTWMETSLALVLLSIIQALIRNPVGLSFLGSTDVAGGKPYFIFAVAFIAYYIIAMAETDIKGWRWAVILYITFGLIDGLINALSGIFPQFAFLVLPIYSNVSYDMALVQVNGVDISQNRFGEVTQLGSMLGLMACSLWRPLSAFRVSKPWRGLVALGALIAIFLGGFRGGVARLFVQFVLGSALRKKWVDILVIAVISMLILMALVVSGSVKSLPYGFQRVLSALPIEVDSRAAADAEGSSEDRFEMWKIALSSNLYISNKLLGDGFNMSARELKAMKSQTASGPQLYKSWTEAALETGAYHGFHVESIRNTGIIGLTFATLTLIVFMKNSGRVISRWRNHHYWGFVLFICMPFLIHPFWYWFVFGSYKVEFPDYIALAGMIKLLSEITIQSESNFKEKDLEDGNQ
ncbi:MAG: hypothetical protein EAZ81_05645 [Verrucomicrobia bacterium]|nr:MAG: hypothetical protein EAZ81_05645 [Verrucomicrobiota bacterium]